MSEPKGLIGRYYFRAFLLVVVLGAVIYLIVRNIGVFGNVLLAVIGFGTVVLIHEFGHFVVAKLSRIKVEAFSLFMPPTLLGVQKTEDGLRFRILPKFFPKKDDESGEGLLSFTVGKGGKVWDTEYRVGLIPFGGFVKMLGQEDIGASEAGDDPRSYVNKPVGTRMAVIAAGVFFNIISAVVAFIIVFLVGVNLPPPVVGSVWPDSPAARVGLKPGDEMIEIAGRSDDLDFSNILMAAALSGRDEAVKLRVRHEDGSEEDFTVVAEELPGTRLRGFGIGRPMSLTVADVSDANALLERTGLLAGDRIKAVNGREVRTHWELEEIIRDAPVPAVTVAERTDPLSKETTLIESQIRLDFRLERRMVKSESELEHIYSMVPRLRITYVSGEDPVGEPGSFLQSGDIILAVGDVENPTYKEMREVTAEHEDRKLAVKVLRKGPDGEEVILTVTVEPKRSRGGDQAMIGLGLVLDAGHPVVAKTIATGGGPGKLAIPRGAVITAVDGVGVSDFYDIIREITKNPGKRIKIEYRLNRETAGDVVFNVERTEEFITVKPDFAEFVPFEYLERLYKAGGPVDAIGMGYRKTVMFIVQAYVTLKRFVGGLVSPKEFMGPVGIVTLSYRIVAEKPLIFYVYFLGLIHAFIGVVNSVPMLPFDGGHILFLLVEKIKGSPMSERVQVAIAYAGWVLVGGFALYITFNDIVRSFF